MSVFRRSPVLRQVLLADAVISGATGLLMFLGADILTNVLGLPIALLRYAGLILLPYGVFVAYVATRRSVHRPAVWAVILINVLWATDSILLLLGGWVTPNTLGYAFVIAQAVVVAVFAELQYSVIRKTATVMA